MSTISLDKTVLDDEVEKIDRIAETASEMRKCVAEAKTAILENPFLVDSIGKNMEGDLLKADKQVQSLEQDINHYKKCMGLISENLTQKDRQSVSTDSITIWNEDSIGEYLSKYSKGYSAWKYIFSNTMIGTIISSVLGRASNMNDYLSLESDILAAFKLADVNSDNWNYLFGDGAILSEIGDIFNLYTILNTNLNDPDSITESGKAAAQLFGAGAAIAEVLNVSAPEATLVIDCVGSYANNAVENVVEIVKDFKNTINDSDLSIWDMFDLFQRSSVTWQCIGLETMGDVVGKQANVIDGLVGTVVGTKSYTYMVSGGQYEHAYDVYKDYAEMLKEEYFENINSEAVAKRIGNSISWFGQQLSGIFR